MDDRAKEALEASIKHWEENAAAKTLRHSSTSGFDCALCKAFPTETCDGCPVAKAVGVPLCKETPYMTAYYARVRWYKAALDDRTIEQETEAREAFQAAARAEVEFLKGLRDA